MSRNNLMKKSFNIIILNQLRLCLHLLLINVSSLIPELVIVTSVFLMQIGIRHSFQILMIYCHVPMFILAQGLKQNQQVQHLNLNLVLVADQIHLVYVRLAFQGLFFQQSFVDPTTGYLNLKKGESMMNTFTTLVSYLFRCNTDVTSLLSGTAVKAIVAYISDYISKTPLKTYMVFDTIRCIFERNSELIGGSVDRQEKARKIMTQIVNSLTSKLEIGAPLASLYLLQNPDHYTDHCFIPFYWTSYVHEARKVWHEDDAKLVEENDLLLLRRSKNLLSGVTPVFDYIYRPLVCEDICLYDWVCTYERVPFSRKVQQQLKDSNVLPDSKSHLSFDSQHPLHSTHGVCPLALGFKWVPNFLGPSLPCSNKGDREFYCASMLALFAPW